MLEVDHDLISQRFYSESVEVMLMCSNSLGFYEIDFISRCLQLLMVNLLEAFLPFPKAKSVSIHHRGPCF